MKSTLSGKCLLCAWLLCATPVLMAAQNPAAVLSLAEAVSLATRSQPLLQSLDDAAAAARAAAVAEGQLPDPRLSVGVQNLPISNSDALRFDRDDMTMATIGLMQEMVPQAKRQASMRRLEAEADQYSAEQSATAREIERDVALAWLDVFEAQRKTALYQNMADDMDSQRQVAVARLSSGGERASEVFRLDSQLAMINDKRLLAERDELKARATLARWLGESASRPLPDALPPAVDVIAGESALQAIHNHPLLQNARQAESVASSDLERARAERLLNWSWEVIYGKRRSDLSDMLTFQLAIDLPWDRANRQDRRTTEKLLLVEKARKLTEDRRRQLLAELEVAVADKRTAAHREQEHQRRLIPAAEARLALLNAGYAAGKQSLAEVWEARRSVLEVQIEHWGILTDHQRADVRLVYLLNPQTLLQEETP